VSCKYTDIRTTTQTQQKGILTLCIPNLTMDETESYTCESGTSLVYCSNFGQMSLLTRYQ